MRYTKEKKQPFKSFESEEEWAAEIGRIVDMTVERLSEKLAAQKEEQPAKAVSSDNAYDSQKARFYEIKSQADNYQKKNPRFNMAEEMKNQTFCYLVFKLGTSVEDAYLLAHKDELLKDREDEGSRITENGAFKNQGIHTKLNPSKLSDKDVSEILDRIQSGESISF